MSNNNGYASYRKTQHINITRLSQQIVLLFERLYYLVSQAKDAIENNDITKRFNMTDKAMKIILGMHAHMDLYVEPENAHLLDVFYRKLYVTIAQINDRDVKKSTLLCNGALSELKKMQEIWKGIDETLVEMSKSSV